MKENRKMKKEDHASFLTENGMTPEEEQRILRASHEARHGKDVTGIMSVLEAIEHLRLGN